MVIQSVFIRTVSLNTLFSCGHFQTTECEQKGTKENEAPVLSAPFVSFVTFCKMDGSLRLVAAAPLQEIRG